MAATRGQVQNRTRRSRTRSRKAGNVLLLADATFVGETTDKQTLPEQGYRINVPGVLERRVVFPPAGPLSGAAAALGHNFLSLDADGPVRHVVPFVRTGENAIPSLGLSAALRASGVNPSTVRIDGQSLIAGDQVMPLETRRVNTEGGVTEILWGLIHFRGPAFLSDMKRRPYQHHSFFDLLYSEEQLRSRVRNRTSILLYSRTNDCLSCSGQIDSSAGRPVLRCLRNAVCRRVDARHSDPRICRGRFPVEPLHAARVARRAHRACCRAGPRRRADRGDPAGVVGGRRIRSDRGSLCVRRDTAVCGRLLDQYHAADARVVFGVVRRGWLSIFLRRARKAEDEAALRPVRVQGRLRSARCQSRSRAAWRAAATDDGALLRHPRVYDRVRKRAAGRDRRHPQRVLHVAWSRSCSRTKGRSTSSSATW